MTTSQTIEKLAKYQQIMSQINAQTANANPVNMHPPFTEGVELTGVYVRDEFRMGMQGPTKIIVVETADGEEVGVWCNVYIANAMKAQNAQYGYLVYILGIAPDNCPTTGRKYHPIRAFFTDPDTI